MEHSGELLEARLLEINLIYPTTDLSARAGRTICLLFGEFLSTMVLASG
jgi:hypothetical protein